MRSNETAPAAVRRVVVRRTWLGRARSLSAQAFQAMTGLPERAFQSARGRSYRLAATPQFRRLDQPIKLCIGSGSAPIRGWVNLDMSPPADILLDVRFGVPLPAASVARIYSEHVIEHLTAEAGMAMLRECHRLLEPSGVMRIATPDLDNLIAAYQGDWRDQDWMKWPEYSWIDSPARMLNAAVRLWGHQYMYSFSELELRLREAGFAWVRRERLGHSDFVDLANLETRLDSLLIVEAGVGEAPE